MQPAASNASRGALSAEVTSTLKNTFIAVTVMMAITATTSYFGIGLIPPVWYASLGLFIGGLVAMLLAYANKNNAMGLVFLAAFAGVMGLMLTHTVAYHLETPELQGTLAQAFGLTVAATVGISSYAIISRKNFSFMGGFLFAALLILVVGMLLNLWLQSPVMGLMLAGAGALIFSAYLLYDVSRVVNKGERNYISASISIYLDILNLFLSILRLLRK